MISSGQRHGTIYTSLIENPEHVWARPTDPRTPTKIRLIIETVDIGTEVQLLNDVLRTIEQQARFMMRDTVVVNHTVVKITDVRSDGWLPREPLA